MNFKYLNNDEKNAIKQVTNGADVTGLALAQTLRAIEKKQQKHGHHLINICEVMGEYDGRECLPYFGCIALADGLKAVENQ